MGQTVGLFLRTAGTALALSALVLAASVAASLHGESDKKK